MDCPICLEDIDKENAFTTPCNHEFHKLCYDKFMEFNKMKRNVMCPLCNDVLKVNDEMIAIIIPHQEMTIVAVPWPSCFNVCLATTVIIMMNIAFYSLFSLYGSSK